MQIKVLLDYDAEVLGEETIFPLEKNQILDVVQIEHHNDYTSDIHLTESIVLMYVPISMFDEV